MIPKAKKPWPAFLHDRQICQRIVAFCSARRPDRILEIGPGPGALTNILEALSPARVLLALEKTPGGPRNATHPAARPFD